MLGTNQTLLRPPVHAPVTDENGMISPTWRTFFANLEPFLQRINQFGFQISNVTPDTQNKISANEGQTMYNTTTKKLQFWNGTAYETVASS